MSFAGLSQPHRRLCRQTLLIEGATVSPEGRLGSGQGVRAVVLSGSSGLQSPTSVGLELTTITARILGLERGQLVLQDPQGRLWRAAAFPTEVGRDNHLLLARAAGRRVSVAGSCSTGRTASLAGAVLLGTSRATGVGYAISDLMLCSPAFLARGPAWPNSRCAFPASPIPIRCGGCVNAWAKWYVKVEGPCRSGWMRP